MSESFAYTTGSPLYACEPISANFSQLGDRITQINVTDGTVISSVAIIGHGWCDELSVDPTTGIWYFIPQNVGHPLHTIDPTTGITVNLNGTIGGFSNTGGLSSTDTMAFDGNGDLFMTRNKVLGTGLTATYSIYKFDKSTGNEIGSCTPSNPYTMELAFNYDNDKMYSLTNSNSLEVVDPNTCAVSETVSITGLVGIPTSLSYNTQDGLFYVMVRDGGNDCCPNETGTLDYYTLQTDGTANLITDDVDGHVGLQTVYVGFEFSVFPDPPDSIAPVISVTESELITILQGSSYDEFASVGCTDDTDGLITNTMITVGNVDTSIRGLQTVEYTCTDEASNESTSTVTYIVKKQSSTGGGTSQTSQLSDIPTLSFTPQAETTPVRTGESVNDLFASLFEGRLNPSETQPFFSSPQSSGSPTTSDRASPVADFFSNLFSNIFG